MKRDPLLSQILDVSLGVKRGDSVWVDGWEHTAPLVRDLAKECEKRGCNATTTVRRENAWLQSLKSGPRELLSRPSAEQLEMLSKVDHYVFTLGPRRPIDWKSVPKDRRGLATIWFLERNNFVREWMKVARGSKVKMLGIESTLATQERAQSLGIPHQAWMRAMREGCLANAVKMRSRALTLSRLLGSHAKVKIEGAGGTRLMFALEERRVQKSDGIVSDDDAARGNVVFLPAGGIGTTVNETSAEGSVVYDRPLRFPQGKVEGLRIQLEAGRIVDWRASTGVGAFQEQLRAAGGDADRFGFFGIGLNPNLQLGFTQDDKVLGCIELNFGANQSRGGKNRGDRDWWGTVSKATVTVGGHRILDGGRILG